MNADQTTEQAIADAAVDKATSVTPSDIEASIAVEYYFTAAQGVTGAFMADLPHCPIPGSDPELTRLTFCVLTLRNGFMVTGESACASLANFNVEIGQKIARENAVQKIWPLMGYELRSKLAAG